MFVAKPPMGWNTWNTFGHEPSEKLVRETADAMVDLGLLEAGYQYLVIDDCWALRKRDANGRLVPDPEKFPNGMKAVSDYVHSKGLKFGMYSCAGTRTCADYPGSFEYEFIDAQTFAEWGVDFLKYDYCYKPATEDGHLLYTRMATALANCGREILFSACSWGVDKTYEWIKSTGANMWRSTEDINDSWKSIKSIAMQQVELQKYNGINCFNDMDMLVVGMYAKGLVGVSGCNDDEYRMHFSLWSLLNSPLMIGCDIRNMSDATKEILLNKEIIAINQDPSGRQPYMVGEEKENGVHKWVKQLDNGDIAIGMFNMLDEPSNRYNTYISLNDLGLNRSTGVKLEMRDLWAHKDLGVFENDMHFAGIPAHGCLMLRARIVRD